MRKRIYITTLLVVVLGVLVGVQIYPTLSRIKTLEATVLDLRAELMMAQKTIGILESGLTAEQRRIKALQGDLAMMQSNPVLALERYIRVKTDEINGLAGPHVIFTGVNLHVRSGSGLTDDEASHGDQLTGLGNLVVGYNEVPFGGLSSGDRGGTHNIIVGSEHKYSSFGGLVAGFRNTLAGDYASVSGGVLNNARGTFSSVSGGLLNVASGDVSSVSGGSENTASGDVASISGGSENKASGDVSSITGGRLNIASGDYANVTGGLENRASGDASIVNGGRFNLAKGDVSSVSGGRLNIAREAVSKPDEGEPHKVNGEEYSVYGDRLSLVDSNTTRVNGSSHPAVDGLSD